jgi:hypothetical protein
VASLKKYASDLGLDRTRFDAALDGGQYAMEVSRDVQDGETYGVDATPTRDLAARFRLIQARARVFLLIVLRRRALRPPVILLYEQLVRPDGKRGGDDADYDDWKHAVLTFGSAILLLGGGESKARTFPIEAEPACRNPKKHLALN